MNIFFIFLSWYWIDHPSTDILYFVLFSINSGSLTPRIVWGIIIEVIVFMVTVALAMINSSEWPGMFFWVTICSVFILNSEFETQTKSWNIFLIFNVVFISFFIAAGGIYQNSVYGLAAKFPFKYTGAVVLGSNISGALTSVIAILTKTYTSSPKTAAIYYFIGAMFVLLACFDTYFALPLNVSQHKQNLDLKRFLINIFILHSQRFYRYHELMHEKENEKSRRLGGNTSNRPPYWTIFKQAFPQLFNVFFIFFVTLTLFPTVQSGRRNWV